MSFDVFFLSGLDDDAVRFPLRFLEDALGRFAERGDPGCWALKFPDGGWCDLSLEEEDEISGFAINRPARSPELWQGLFEVMQKTPGIVYWSGGGSCVADPLIISRIDFVDHVSPVTVVENGARILECIEESWRAADRYTDYVRQRFQNPPP